MIVHGLDLSYFTGKLEGALRAKGLSYRLAEMDTAAFADGARRTGVRQMPHLQRSDGRWLTDTPAILDALEAEGVGSGLTPRDPALAVLAELIELYADEHLWRPALYYRWAFEDDARLMSGRLADGMLRDLRLPRALRRWIILHRQRRVYLAQEGVTRANRHEIERDYLLLLDALQPVLAARPWLLGAAPTRADIGLFGPLFRHFFCDPTPARILRDRAPAVAAWVTRLWALEPDPARDASGLTDLPEGLGPLMALIGERFLPEAVANAEAVAAGHPRVAHQQGGAIFRYAANPYRAWRLDRLMARVQALEPTALARLETVVGAGVRAVLTAPRWSIAVTPPAAGPAPRDRWWRRADRT